jgi:hypothetical protein
MNWDGKEWAELSTGKKTGVVITIISAIGIWVLGIIYSLLARMLIAGAGLIALGLLIAKIRQPTPTVLAYLCCALWGVGGLLLLIAIIKWFMMGY